MPIIFPGQNTEEALKTGSNQADNLYSLLFSLLDCTISLSAKNALTILRLLHPYKFIICMNYKFLHL